MYNTKKYYLVQICYSAWRQDLINRGSALSRNISLVGWMGKEMKEYGLGRLRRCRMAVQLAGGDPSCEGIGKEYVSRQGLLAYLLCI